MFIKFHSEWNHIPVGVNETGSAEAGPWLDANIDFQPRIYQGRYKGEDTIGKIRTKFEIFTQNSKRFTCFY